MSGPAELVRASKAQTLILTTPVTMLRPSHQPDSVDR